MTNESRFDNFFHLHAYAVQNLPLRLAYDLSPIDDANRELLHCRKHVVQVCATIATAGHAGHQAPRTLRGPGSTCTRLCQGGPGHKQHLLLRANTIAAQTWIGPHTEPGDQPDAEHGARARAMGNCHGEAKVETKANSMLTQLHAIWS